MAYRGTPVVVCIPAGRKRTLTPLLHHLRSMGDLIDRIDLWENTTVEDDLEFIHSQAGDKTRVVAFPDDGRTRTVAQRDGEKRFAKDNSRFYKTYDDPDPIYIRIDDDVVWLHADAIRELVKVRRQHDIALLVSANVWNNAVFDHYRQQRGHLPDIPPIDMFCMDQIGWANGEVAVRKHEILLNAIERGYVNDYMMPDRFIARNDKPVHFSTNCVAIRGADMVKMGPLIDGHEEEQFLMYQAYEQPMHSIMVGNSLAAHYSFFMQRQILDQTDILDRYTRIAERTYHEQYYRLMGFDS
jgi:hypothetical protein